jgi:hypothetical protein
MSEEWCVRVVTFSLYNYIEVTISTVNTNEMILMDSNELKESMDNQTSTLS